MTHPPEWPIGEPCPVCGSPDILECELRINADKIEMEPGSAANAATPSLGRRRPTSTKAT